MFVVLNIKSYDKKVAKRKIKKINRSAPVICHTSKGLPFYLIDVCEERRGIDWSGVAARCGRYASRIIAPRNITIPDCRNLHRFVPSSFVSLLILNTSLRLLEEAKIPPSEFIITVSDRNAAVSSSLHKLLPFASQIRVITACPERYASACAKAIDEYGASVIIRSVYEKTRKPDIIISCDGTYTPLMADSAIISSGRNSGGALRIDCRKTELTPAHKKIMPPGIEPTDFAGALSELCACSEYADSVFVDTESSCKKCNKTGAECLKCYAGRAIKT